MSFLAAVAAKVVQWLLAKGAAALVAALKYLWAKKKAKDQTDEIIKRLEDAKTKEELDRAADDIIRNF